jgi:DNA-binding response OmpR family regulator
MVTAAAAVLVTDAEPATRGFLEQHLPRDGFQLVGAQGVPDLVLAGNVEVVDRWVDRAAVIVLGRAEADVVDRVRALRRGCDDYVPQPFDYQELVERIRAVLRRARPHESDRIDAPPVRIDLATRDVRVDGRRVQLAQKEFQLLARLAREPRRVFTKAELLHDVWDYRSTARTRTLDSHASRLRRKLRDAGCEAPLVENVWGVGYRLLGELPIE